MPEVALREVASVQIQVLVLSSEEGAGTQTLAPEVVVFFPHAVSSFCLPSNVVLDIDGFLSLVLANLGAIFGIGPQGQADPMAVVTTLQSLVVASPEERG